MSAVPDIVRLRMEQLALDPEAIQAPNFTISDLTLHEPPAHPGEPLRASWALDGHEWAFSLIGQLSAHHTFLGEHGDLSALTKNGQDPSLGAFLKAKWKMTIVPVNALDETPAGLALKRQFDILKKIQDSNISRKPLKSGTTLGCSFTTSTKRGLRASAFSENIFHSGATDGEDVVEATLWPDPDNTFTKLVDERKEGLVVKPILLYAPDDNAVPIPEAGKVFTPGSWVQVLCTLKMWDTSDSTPSRARHDRRGPVRSFQLCFDAAQKLCDGRLDEGALHTKPAAKKLKRPFSAVAGSAQSDVGPQAKVRRIAEGTPSDDVMMS